MGSSYEKGDCDSHGVSEQWVKDRIKNATTKGKDLAAKQKRWTQFAERTAAVQKGGKTAASRRKAGVALERAQQNYDHNKAMSKKMHNAAQKGEQKPSGWAAWKAKGGGKKHGMQMGSGGFGMTHGYEPDEETFGNEHEYR